MSLGELCNREVVIVGRQGSIRDAAGLMRRHHVGDVVVVDEAGGERRPVGMLTDRDIVLELLARDVELDKVTVGDVMSRELVTGSEEDDLAETLQIMRSRGIRRLPVVDRKGCLVGVFSVDDAIDLIAEQLTNLRHLIANEQEKERRTRV